nr:translational initiation factor 1 [Syzygium cinereum]
MKDPTEFYTYTVGGRGKIEVSHYDSTRGRIIYRCHNKDSND